MTALATTRMSTKGQIVIPESVRKQMNLVEGTPFVVVAENDNGEKIKGGGYIHTLKHILRTYFGKEI